MPSATGGRSPRVLLYVQHLLGVGHLFRAARIAKALGAAGFEITLVMGGSGFPDLDVGCAKLVRLPPVRMGEAGFGALAHPDGKPFDTEAQAQRAALLLDIYDRAAPDVLMVEAFPFGRRQMRFELVPLLARARSQRRPPLTVSSIRDILQVHRRPARVAETLDYLDRFFDLVLVHGDPRLARLEASFPDANRFVNKIVYTGIVAPPQSIDNKPRVSRFGAVVSAGGGAVGAALLKAAIEARPRTTLASRPWLILAGPNLPQTTMDELRNQAGPDVEVAAFVPELARLLRDAEVSISQAGYNTVADILVAGCRAVLVPYAAGGETEQSTRAHLLSEKRLAISLSETDLTGDSLSAAIDRALSLPLGSAQDVALDGAERTAEIIGRHLELRHEQVGTG